MKCIRNNCFETNSSSTHAIAIDTKKWSEWYHSIQLKPDNKLHIQFKCFDGYNEQVTMYIADKVAFCMQFEIQKSGWYFNSEDSMPQEEAEEFREDLETLPIYADILNLVQGHEPKCQGIAVDSVKGIIDHQTLNFYYNIYDFLEEHNVTLEQFLFGDTYLIMGRD